MASWEPDERVTAAKESEKYGEHREIRPVQPVGPESFDKEPEEESGGGEAAKI